MRNVEVGSNFKVKGIRGLYLNPSTGRYWVRYCLNGVDRQRTFSPSNVTFSGLERRASVELRALKKEMESEQQHKPKVTKHAQDSKESAIQAMNDAIQAMNDAIKTVYSERVSLKTFQKMKRHLDGFMLAKNEKSSHEVNSYNRQHLQTKLATLTPSMQEECFSKASTAFKKLISIGLHKGMNPCDFVKPPKKQATTREGFFTAEELTVIKNKISDSEARLFFELCAITGQRPVDIHRLNLDAVTPVFKFHNGKTNRAARVACIIPGEVVERCHKQVKWSRLQDTLSSIINSTIRQCFGEDDSRTLYHVRHSFLSNLRHMGNSLDDCKLWTHAGDDAAELHYIHESQDRANMILRPYLELLGYVF